MLLAVLCWVLVIYGVGCLIALYYWWNLFGFDFDTAPQALWLALGWPGDVADAAFSHFFE